MHRSRVSVLVIDCQDLDVGASFWTQALGAAVTWRDDNGVFVSLGPAAGGLHVLLQRVPEPKTAKNHVHFDIHTDDVEAEVTRLEALGARRHSQQEFWWIMQDPFGNEFCVVRGRPEEFAEHSNVWE